MANDTIAQSRDTCLWRGCALCEVTYSNTSVDNCLSCPSLSLSPSTVKHCSSIQHSCQEHVAEGCRGLRLLWPAPLRTHRVPPEVAGPMLLSRALTDCWQIVGPCSSRFSQDEVCRLLASLVECVVNHSSTLTNVRWTTVSGWCTASLQLSKDLGDKLIVIVNNDSQADNPQLIFQLPVFGDRLVCGLLPLRRLDLPLFLFISPPLCASFCASPVQLELSCLPSHILFGFACHLSIVARNYLLAECFFSISQLHGLVFFVTSPGILPLISSLIHPVLNRREWSLGPCRRGFRMHGLYAVSKHSLQRTIWYDMI